MAALIEEDLKHCLEGVTVSRLMGPNEANFAGNVHGGNILKLMEEAGCILATRYYNVAGKKNLPNYQPGMAALVRVERTDFLQPMYIGEVAELHTELTFTSAHSIEVLITVFAEDCIKGQKRLTNRARLWYVSMSSDEKVLPIPPLPNTKKIEQGKIRYEKQKKERAAHRHTRIERVPSILQEELDPQTVGYSQTTLRHLVGVVDTNSAGYVMGGVIMKLMDECAGLVAVKHCKTNVVTASMDATNFHQKVKKGSLVTLTGFITFTSPKSIEIEVVVDAEFLRSGSAQKERAVSSFFTFVSLDSNHRPMPVPQIMPVTEEELERHKAAEERYLERKRQREQESTS
ncbi:cytosolic acyl coenzyme A thioester hydrolase isoform X2 [Lingula anatina]|nr:cytosolic acyl coenzyme A thioester hydrolase isoform X2 [Lingula anatina]|eukprot:XP_013411440.1 cytosolic acyl coenzyme A thioester hydrolase isoform X2 [Lingula anatina]